MSIRTMPTALADIINGVKVRLVLPKTVNIFFF